ncbi:MAG: AAA family ATPase, partial [Deltaproteobacteria bacterium]|nr:AAA family ATPase [Deltaproteobacteria bacterium]
SREGALPVRECVRLMTQVLEALACAHAKGIVHRDIKPGNLMLSTAGVRRSALVLDFGLGGLAEDRRRKEWETLTQTREFLGTPMYAAPEQLLGETATPRSDLYAWGLIFLECLTGRHPFEEEGAAARLMTGGGAVELPEWLQGHRLGALLETVTAREVEKRDVSVEALIEALDEIARGELPVAPEVSLAPAPLADSGERRHLTVMFCDLVGSTALSQQLEAEAYRGIVQAYQGYPQAHEDDAERAVRAGREILREIEMLGSRIRAEHGVDLAARIGVHSGPVVIGEMGGGEKKETLALGDTPNIAARLEGFAEPDTVVISDATLQLVAGLFVTEDRGTPDRKGIEEPIRVHRVLQPSGVTSRLDRATGLTPFVGREQELALLQDRFEHAQEGRGQAVLIGGEAGIGKSRLVQRLREQLRETAHSWLQCQTSPYTQSSALHPLIAMLEEALDFREEDLSEEKLERLERGLAHAGLELDEAVPLLASLLSLRLSERYAPLEISPQLQRQRTLGTLLAWVLALGEKQPVVLFVEDLHWIDPSTLEWLGLVIEQCPTANVLLLMTHRPTFEPPWLGREHLHGITLSRLSRRHSQDLVARAIAETALPAELVERIASRSDGVPLFVEELARGVVEAGTTSLLSERDIPETLQDSLMARLDRLGEAKEVAQLGATIGREFEYTLLAAVAPLQDTTLREGLGRLVNAELIYQRGLPPSATYTFKHALVQDTAYQSLLDSQRKELHGRIADAILERMPEAAEQQPELVAHHLSEGPEPGRAVEYWLRAGERALSRWAIPEADSHFRHGLEGLDCIRDGASRDRSELSLQRGLGAVGGARADWATDETEQIWRRALELADKLGDKPARANAVWGLSTVHQTRGELGEALRLAIELRDTGLELDDIWAEIAGWNQMMNIHYMLGEPAAAMDRLDQMLARDPVSTPDPTHLTYGVSQRVCARSWGANAAWMLGYPARAISLGEESIALARQRPYAMDVCYAIGFLLAIRLGMGQIDAVRVGAEEMRSLAEEQGIELFAGNAQVLAAAADAVAGELDGDPAAACLRGFERLSSGARGNRTLAPTMMWTNADVLRRVGRLEEAGEWVAAALEIADSTEQRYWNAELHRTFGEIVLARDEPDETEARSRFERALEIARSQQARSLELRAATSLARLLRDQGEHDEARALLQPVYDWFTEGFDTLDLKDAKALLDELT